MRQVGEWYGQPDNAELELRVHRLELQFQQLLSVVEALTDQVNGARPPAGTGAYDRPGDGGIR